MAAASTSPVSAFLAPLPAGATGRAAVGGAPAVAAPLVRGRGRPATWVAIPLQRRRRRPPSAPPVAVSQQPNPESTDPPPPPGSSPTAPPLAPWVRASPTPGDVLFGVPPPTTDEVVDGVPADELAASPSSRLRNTSARAAVVATAWAGLLLSVSALAPPGLSLWPVLSHGPTLSAHPLGAALWGLRACLVAAAAILLTPGSRDQRLPTWAFLGAALAGGGGYVLGPYLALRRYRPSVGRSEIGAMARVTEGRVFSALFLGLAAVAVVGVVSVLGGVGLAGARALLMEDPWTWAAAVDVVYLWVALWGPLCEDMRRRGLYEASSFADNVLAAGVVAGGTVGVLLYGLLRPKLEDRRD
ncbi:hypothetical protein MMPV_000538 [Pyropia vietnamensis]